jgi:hypothetical protein
MGVKTVSLSGSEKEIFARASAWKWFVVLETSENLVTPYQIPIRICIVISA